ncbi:ROK family transcriptional regulator [Rhizobium sp. 16-449-1b]|uniref:ROK family transcriptional regulator n=1 Tax=Rhizobium sp. 16-449-1b TaxID=2819989 RepID=UPI001ADCCD79|nr:ROK family transcriptional regulator [Rhizobium sp. 16-449-1b]MBO9197521.1 ROK family transcriptional regulator [Rhizobium sp. 16-449-1b]
MSMPRAVRHINEMRVLDVVLRSGRISRANIAKELNLTRSTASSIVAGLADAGLLVEDTSEEDKGAGTGRPGTFVQLNADHALFIGADIGIGTISIVALGLDAKPIANEVSHFDVATTSATEVIDSVAAGVKKLQARIGEKHKSRGLCVTVPGLIDNAGDVLRAPFLNWRNEPLLARISSRLPEFPTVIAENDANAFAFADAFQEGREPASTEIYLFLDSGVGGAIIRDGELMRGVDGYAAEFGHVIIGDHGFVKIATPEGSVESYIGRDAVLARYKHHGGSAENFSQFYEAVVGRVPAASATLRDWTFYLARTIAMIGSIFNPSRIVLGGTVASLFPQSSEMFKDALAANQVADQPVPEIRLSSLGLEGPALGGALILHRQMFSLDEALVFRTKIAV